MKDYGKSMQMFEKAYKHSKHELIFLQLGTLYVLQNQYQKAIETYKEALEHSIQNTEIMTILGIIYMRMGDMNEAF